MDSEVKGQRVRLNETCLFFASKGQLSGFIAFPTQHLAHFNYFIFIQKYSLPCSLGNKPHETSLCLCGSPLCYPTQYMFKICFLIDCRVFGIPFLHQVLSELFPYHLALYFSAHQPDPQLPAPEFLYLRSFSSFWNMFCPPAWQVVSTRKLASARRPQPMTGRVGL